jgi:hypothetical protein
MRAFLHESSKTIDRKDGPISWEESRKHEHLERLQSETKYHSQAPLDRLYSALSHSTADSIESVALMTRMADAIATENGRIRHLREREAALAKADESSGDSVVAMLNGLHALMAAKVDLMRGAFTGGQVARTNQYETVSGNVLALA